MFFERCSIIILHVYNSLTTNYHHWQITDQLPLLTSCTLPVQDVYKQEFKRNIKHYFKHYFIHNSISNLSTHTCKEEHIHQCFIHLWWIQTTYYEREIQTRGSNHLGLSTQRSSSSFVSSLGMPELPTISVRLSPATLQRQLMLAACIHHLVHSVSTHISWP